MVPSPEPPGLEATETMDSLDLRGPTGRDSVPHFISFPVKISVLIGKKRLHGEVESMDKSKKRIGLKMP